MRNPRLFEVTIDREEQRCFTTQPLLWFWPDGANNSCETLKVLRVALRREVRLCEQWEQREIQRVRGSVSWALR